MPNQVLPAGDGELLLSEEPPSLSGKRGVFKRIAGSGVFRSRAVKFPPLYEPPVAQVREPPDLGLREGVVLRVLGDEIDATELVHARGYTTSPRWATF